MGSGCAVLTLRPGLEECAGLSLAVQKTHPSNDWSRLSSTQCAGLSLEVLGFRVESWSVAWARAEWHPPYDLDLKSALGLGHWQTHSPYDLD